MKYENQAAEHYGAKYIQHPAASLLSIMMEELGRNGRKQKTGFYDYSTDGKRMLWPALTDHFPTDKTTYDVDEIKERVLFVQVIESVWCLQEGIIKTIAEANLGSIHGWGFPAFKGGSLQFIEDYGRDAFISKCKVYEKQHGPRFKVPGILLKKKLL